MGPARLHRLHIDLTTEEWRVVTQLAMLRGMTTAEFLRDALRLEPLIKPTPHTELKLVERPER